MNKIRKILFMGNSITKHGPNPQIGWEGNWGMAASAEENDYVHKLMKHINSIDPAVHFLIKNIADFEREFWSYDISQLKEFRDYEADLVIMRIAENIDEKQLKLHKLSEHYTELVRYINPNDGLVICTNCFWNKPTVSKAIEQIAVENGYQFVDIHDLGKDDANMAKDLFWHAGVGAHPSNQGMEKIAFRIWEKLLQLK